MQCGKAGRLGKPQAFHFDASAFESLGGEERQGKDKMARGVKSNFRTSRIVLVKYMSSTASNFSKYSMPFKQPFWPTLPARLLQYPNVNSLASSPGRKIFRSRSQRIWFLPQNVMSSSPPSWVWSTLKNFTVKYSKRRGRLPSSRCREAPATSPRRG